MYKRWMPPAILAILTCLLVGQVAVAMGRPLAQSATDGKLASPPQGAVLAAGEAIVMEVEMGQDAAVERVEFYANGDLLTTLFEVPWRYVWPNAPSDVYTIEARGVSSSGAATELGRAQVLVQRASQPGEPVPPSPVIIDVSWAPTSTITRIGVDSDNWTPTWADDGHLYSGYGDGKGFAPKLDEKISMGFGRISGAPPNVVGTNVRSADEQPYGGGANGKKNSGLLMVDNVLYMWVRNVVYKGKGCQLAWSTDHAQSWQWSDWLFADFGYCAFVNYGPNYAGARDGYIYMVTPDGPSAYVAYQDFVLTRVPKTQIANRSAYEFLRAVDANNTPIWTSDMTQRGAVFSTVGEKAGRSGMVYNAALGRYLWWQGINVAGPDERYEGGFGVYDAPEPWGPWTVVTYTELWDHPPGAVGTFPTQWMSDDGRTLYLAFDANDGLSIRKVTLEIFDPRLPNDEAYAPVTPTTTPADPTSTYTPTASSTAPPTWTPSSTTPAISTFTQTPTPASPTPISTSTATITTPSAPTPTTAGVFTPMATAILPPPTRTPFATNTPTPTAISANPILTPAATFEPDVVPAATETSTPEPPIIRTERRLYLPIARRAKP